MKDLPSRQQQQLEEFIQLMADYKKDYPNSEICNYFVSDIIQAAYGKLENLQGDLEDEKWNYPEQVRQEYYAGKV